MAGITRIGTLKALKDSLKNGSTMWVVHGEDGIRVFSKTNYDDESKLCTELKPFIENRKVYEVYAN